MNDQMKAAFLV